MTARKPVSARRVVVAAQIATALLVLAVAACGREDEYPYLGEQEPPAPQTGRTASAALSSG
jgi:hypothetical protein